MPSLNCLLPLELEQFLLGLTDEDRSLEIENHLQACGECQQHMTRLAAKDELVQALRRQQAGDPAGAALDASSELVRLLVPHFKRIGQPPGETVRMAGVLTDDTAPYVSSPPPASSAPAPGGEAAEQIGRYIIRGELGRGGMGAVLDAFDPLLNRPIAIKVLQAEWIAEKGMAEQMVREAQAAAAVQHDNIVPIYSVEMQNGQPCIVMPLLQGCSLHQRLLRNEGPLPLDEFLQIAGDTCRGLAAAHAAGLIHCDIKPGNLWLEAPNGRVKILDFGLAITHGDGSEGFGGISGTPGYLAPEQATGRPLDQRTDIFSLGCVLYCMATGQAAFTGETQMRALWTVLSPPPAAASTVNPALPEELGGLIDRMVSREPGDRPASVTEVLDVLGEFDRRRADRRRLVVRRRWLMAMSAAVLLSGGGVGAWAMFMGPQPARPVPVTLLGGLEPLAVKLRRDGVETPVALLGETVVSLPPGEYSLHLVEDRPGRELLPRTFVVDEERPRLVPVVLVGEVARHRAHSRAVTGVAVRQEGPARAAKSLAVWSTGLDRSLVVWDGAAADGHRFTALHHEARCVAVSPDGRQVATGGGNKQPPHELAIRVWDSRTLAEIEPPFEGHGRLVLGVACSPDGRQLVSAGAEGIFVWQIATRESSALPGSETGTVHAVAFSRDGRQLLSGGESGAVALWDMQARTLQRAHVACEGTLRAVAFLSDGYAAAGDDGTVRVWTMASDKPRVLLIRPQPVAALAVSPAGDLLIFGDGAGIVGVWSVKSQQVVHEFRGHRGAVTALACVGDGRHAVSGGADGTVRLWQLPYP